MRLRIAVAAIVACLAAGVWAADVGKLKETSRAPAGAEKVVGPVVGAVTPSSAVFAVIPNGVTGTVQVVVSEQATPETRLLSTTAVATGEQDKAVKCSAEGLKPGTRYDYVVTLDGQRLDLTAGQFRTHPPAGQPASFMFAFGNSQRQDRPEISGLTAAAEHDLLFFLSTGDLFYSDIRANDPAVFRRAYSRALARRSQRALLRKAPLVFMWDDHDYGPNDSDRTAPGRAASGRVYRETMPHYPLPAGPADVPVYQAFTVGRVRFILTDLRSERSPRVKDAGARTMMGKPQFEWFKKELTESAASHGLVLWVSSVPWTSNPPARAGDNWLAYEVERRAIADFVKSRGIRNLLVVAGDAHSTSADDGTHGDYATGGGAPLPTILAAPLDNSGTSVKGGPYSQGVYRSGRGENMFGLVTIVDDGKRISLHFSGRNNRQKEKISLVFVPGGEGK